MSKFLINAAGALAVAIAFTGVTGASADASPAGKVVVLESNAWAA